MENAEKKTKTPEEIAQSLEEYLGNSVKVIDREDTFDFKCQRCGQCCVGRSDIVLTPFDIYEAAKHLGITHKEFVDKYAHVSIGGHSRLPVVTLAIDSRGWCPFLKFDVKNGGLFGCSINDVKPGACRNHPIGIATSFKHNEDSDDILMEDLKEFYIKVEQCGNSQGHNNPVKVADWVAKSEAQQEERIWAHKLQSIPSMIMNVEKFLVLMAITAMTPPGGEDWSDEDMRIATSIAEQSKFVAKSFFDTIMAKTYIDFVPDRPFCEQAEENAIKIKELCLKCKELYETSHKAFVESGGTDEILNDLGGEL